MSEVFKSDNGFVVDAVVLADAFGISAQEVRDEMRGGFISSRTEIGAGDDEGRWRMTFYRGDRAFRIVVDAEGTVLSRGRFPVTPRQRSASRTAP